MYEREVDGRREVAITDIEALVPENHLVRKIEKVMDYEWIYERVAPYYSAAKNVRPGTDPVVLVKMVLLQHLFGIPSLRQTYQRACDTISYRWFLGYGLLDKLPHFATVSYAFCRRFPEELAAEIFEHRICQEPDNSYPFLLSMRLGVDMECTPELLYKEINDTLERLDKGDAWETMIFASFIMAELFPREGRRLIVDRYKAYVQRVAAE